MPWGIVENHPECPKEKPWGVINKETGRKVGCHATKEEAREHQKALYKNVPEKKVGAFYSRYENHKFQRVKNTHKKRRI